MYAAKNIPRVQTMDGIPAAEDPLPRVVIIGAGFGGLKAALHLRNAPVHLTVIDRTNHHLFQPLLYQVATATLSPGEIGAPIRHVLKRQRNAEVIMAEVTGIDTAQKRVLLGERRVPYDYLIVATGAREKYFGHDEWKPLAPGLKSIEDARAIRHKLLHAFETAEQECDVERQKELLTFVIVGAGPTGVEMAGAVAEVARKVLTSEFRHIDPSLARIVLIEAHEGVLGTFPETLSQRAERELRRLGVEICTKTFVTQIDERGVVANGERIQACTVFWTAGVQASPAANWLGVEADGAGRVPVAEDLSVPGLENVFVIGDTAACTWRGRLLPGVAPVAMQQGVYVARLIAARVAGRTIAPFHYVDKGNLATIGRGFAVLHMGRLKLWGFPAWVLWLLIHIYYLIGFENRILVLMQWGWAYVTFRRGVRLITQVEPLASSSQPEPNPEAINAL